MKEFLQSVGINMSTLSIPNYHVPEGVWILAIGIVIGAIVWRSIHHRLRARFVRTHLRHLLRAGVITEIHFDGDANQVFVVDNSNEVVIPAKPYKGDVVPAKHFEGITDLEIISGALKLKALANVVFSSWSTKDNGPQHWRVKPLPASAVMTDAPQQSRRKDRSQAVTATPAGGNNRDKRPEPVSEAVH